MRFTKTNAPANGRAASWRMPRAGPANGPMPRCNARGPESAAPSATERYRTSARDTGAEPPAALFAAQEGRREGPAARGEEICERLYGRPARPADGPNDAESQASACYSPLRPAAQSDEVLPS